MGKGDDPNCAAAGVPMSPHAIIGVTGSRAMTAAKPGGQPNEDDFVFDQQRGVAAIFDGMGGVRNGEEASRLAASTMQRIIGALPAEGHREGHAQRLLEQLRGELIVQRTVSSFLREADCTAVICVRDRDHVEIAWTGDSRAYLLTSDGALDPLTADHDQFTDLSGEHRQLISAILDEADGRSDAHGRGGTLGEHAFKFRNKVSSALSRGPIGSVRVPVSADDAVILCSDGIHDNLRASEMRQIAAAHVTHRDEVIGALMQAAITKAATGQGRAKPDDTTAVLLSIS